MDDRDRALDYTESVTESEDGINETSPSLSGPHKKRRRKPEPSCSNKSTDYCDAKSNKTKLSCVSAFLQKTYTMLSECDPKICSWSADGESFIVKDPDIFERDIIPRYFDHNKFSSFARQLNFYGFRKVQSKPIRHEDFTPETAKYLNFANENFKRDREDLLVLIQRSTRGNFNDQEKEIQSLEQRVEALEGHISSLESQIVQINIAFTTKVSQLENQLASFIQQFSASSSQQPEISNSVHYSHQEYSMQQTQPSHGNYFHHGNAAPQTEPVRPVSYFGDSSQQSQLFQPSDDELFRDWLFCI